MAQRKLPFMSVEDYLVLDDNSRDARYEYLDGEVYLLAGGSIPHSRLAIKLATALENALSKSNCWVYNSDTRLKLSETCYVYPDLSISCDPRDKRNIRTIQHPSVVIEILSPSTEATDRGTKFAYYRACPNIQEYVMVSSQRILIEVCRREDNGWSFHLFGSGDTLVIATLDLHISVDDLYRNTGLDDDELE